MDYSRQEFMAIVTGRELRDGELAIFGVGLSMLAGYFAIKNHAPNLMAFTEGGVFGSTPVGGLPWGIECNRISANATSFTNAIDALGCLVASGRCDVGIIGAAQIDKYGNVNTTGIWDPDQVPWKVGRYTLPRVRLNGSGGANEIAVGCKRYIIMVTHEKKRFVDKVDYISSPGYINGGNDREKYGFPGGGPSAIITTLGILRPDPVTKEFYLDAYFPYATIDEIKANTGWELKVSPDVKVIPEPTEQELANLRAVDVTGSLRKK
ncbi:CoA-transferase subunit beta [Syntrophothermus lipocalidus]|uniref:3-oxoadipate CoA-transferase n=1 Tax=Syntrophothermus lipocalidus (strain DSM 12680 / TGB-C1) TaxID=643648 RepID=D7CMN3_SYNLT|nr:CoA-transferase [Syntrophothermus lipocalidus]ADI01968.1 3-oxoadipate CoA-transferase [Syntrophothermus lipocalidus DSM 12680]HOV43867.1 CoA-transferase [Syntrophothermus lipocalidus]